MANPRDLTQYLDPPFGPVEGNTIAGSLIAQAMETARDRALLAQFEAAQRPPTPYVPPKPKPPLTLAAAISEVDALIATGERGDPEAFHSDEDEFYARILRAVAVGEPDAVEMAKEAVRLMDATEDYERWYA